MLDIPKIRVTNFWFWNGGFCVNIQQNSKTSFDQRSNFGLMSSTIILYKLRTARCCLKTKDFRELACREFCGDRLIIRCVFVVKITLLKIIPLFWGNYFLFTPKNCPIILGKLFFCLFWRWRFTIYIYFSSLKQTLKKEEVVEKKKKKSCWWNI